MSRVLLTGATGLLGRPTLEALLQGGHEVHAVARTPGEDVNGISWHQADLHRGCELVGGIEPEVLIHLAWYAEHGEFWSSQENVRWVETSLALLRAFIAAGGSRALFTGTCAEYDWSRDIYPESAPLGPVTLYGASKRGLHEVARALAEQAGISLAWARLFFLYGPHETPGRFVPSIVRPLLRREPARMSAGTQRRDFLHVADAGSAMTALAESQVTGAVNIASGTGVELRDLAKRIAGRLGAEELLEIGALAPSANDPPSLVAEVPRLRDEVGWRARIELDDGLEDVIAWWREREGSEPHARPPGLD